MLQLCATLLSVMWLASLKMNELLNIGWVFSNREIKSELFSLR